MLFLLRLNSGKKPAPEPSSLRVLSPVKRFDLDDLGPEVGQHQAAGRPHHHVGEFDDADAGTAAARFAWEVIRRV